MIPTLTRTRPREYSSQYLLPGETTATKKQLLTVVTLFLLASCATRYQPLGFGGGYCDTRIDANTYSVSFRGNGYTSQDRVSTYMLYRCAEVTDQAGYDYFVIVSGGTNAQQSLFSTPGSYTSTTTGSAVGVGNVITGSAVTSGTYTPPQTLVITRYGGNAIIKVFKGEKPADNPSASLRRKS